MNNPTLTQFTLALTTNPSSTPKYLQISLPINNKRQIILNSAFDEIGRGLNLDRAQIFYADFVNRVNVFLGVFPFCQTVTIALESVVDGVIQIQVKDCCSPAGEMVDELDQTIQNYKRNQRNKKVKERTIQEAILAVRQWRQYYDTPDNQSGRRIYTLDEAAKKVGMAKKTLDDYYNHLRIAQEHDFNLQRFSETKIGILRKFVKIAKEGGLERLQREMPQYLIETNIEKYWNNFTQL